MMRAVLAATVLATMGVSSAALAQGAVATSQVEFNRTADALKPGQWVWAPQIARSGPMTVYVDLSRQVATVYRDGVRIAVSTVSTGKPGHETPTGVFTILQKDADHHSSKYNNAPMKFQERLTWDGVALHAGGLPGYPESHGCIHLPLQFAKLLFNETSMGGTVIVAGKAGVPDLVPAAGVLAPMAPGGVPLAHQPLGPDEAWRWQPELAPTGPVAIVISKSDQRMIVLRNGIEIGRAKVSLPNTDIATHVLTLAPDATGRNRWIEVGVPGHEGEGGTVVDLTTTEGLRMPAGFYTNLQGVIAPGTSILITEARVNSGTTGQKMTVMAAE
jgi:hypothetical protein